MSYSTKRLDHLGIVSGVFDAFKIKDIIDELIPSQQRNVTHGEAVKAMVLNALGFTSRALYLTEEFFRTKPIELIREGLDCGELSQRKTARTRGDQDHEGLLQRPPPRLSASGPRTDL